MGDGPHLRSFWTLYGVVGKRPNVHTNDHTPTLEEAGAVRERVEAMAGLVLRNGTKHVGPRQLRETLGGSAFMTSRAAPPGAFGTF